MSFIVIPKAKANQENGRSYAGHTVVLGWLKHAAVKSRERTDSALEHK